jgi:shikimate kinase
MSPMVVLVGPPGAGKSTVGRLVAEQYGVDFRDTDADVEAVAGKTVADIFVEDGEPAFRALEATAVQEAPTGSDGVVALGGGAVLDPQTRAALRGHHVVFLDVGLTDALARVGFNRDRPLLLGNPRAQLKAMLDDRRPFYAEVAVMTVATDARPAADVAAEVAAGIGACR